jgi:hypothetical protein
MPANYLSNPDAWILANYGPGYSQDGGVTSIGTSANGGRQPITMTNKKMTPETHPWAFGGTGDVDVNGIIYGNNTGEMRQASDAERKASYDSRNFNRNGGKGLDPALMKGMTRRMGQGNNTYGNEFGRYTQQRETYNPITKKWTQHPSTFTGKDAQGNDVNWANTAPGQYGDGSVRTPNFADSGFNLYGGGGAGGPAPAGGGGGVPGGPVPLPPGNGPVGPKPTPNTPDYLKLPPGITVGGAAKAKQPWYHRQPSSLEIQAAQAAALRTT